MSLFVTATGEELVSITEARDWCRVLNEDHDTILTALITAAREKVENDTGRTLVEKTIVQRRDGFPCSRVIELEGAPVRSVTSIVYVDANGSTQTLSASRYTVDIYSTPARVVLDYEESWPSTDEVPNAVRVTYEAGYNDEAGYELPPTLKTAVRFLIAHWFSHREPDMVGVSIVPIPKTYDNLIFPWKVFI